MTTLSNSPYTPDLRGFIEFLEKEHPEQVVHAYREHVIEPLRAFARLRIDVRQWLIGTLVPGTSPIRRLVGVLDSELYHGATLQDMPAAPPGPRFVINATNLTTGVLWRFSKPYMADYRLGCVPEPTVSLATAVAASCAFPPFYSPMRLPIDESMYSESGKCKDQVPDKTIPNFHELRRAPQLADGGVYDNLGLETVWKRYRTVLASDGGGAFRDAEHVRGDLVLQSIRVMKTIDRQVRAQRRNQLVASYVRKESDAGWRAGAYWGIRTPISEYDAPRRLPCPADRTLALADVSTRLSKLDEVVQERLINWGYASADASVRSYYGPAKDASPPDGFPFPKAKV